jgi:hypothetical protein
MYNFEVQLIYDKTVNKYYEINETIIEPNFEAIKLMPKEEQREYLENHLKLEKAINEMIEALSIFHDEILKRGDNREVSFLRQELRKSSAYIRRLGGDPTLLTYVNESEL